MARGAQYGHKARVAGRETRASQYPLSVHGMLSAAIMIGGYVTVAIIAAYAAVKVIRGGPHDG